MLPRATSRRASARSANAREDSAFLKQVRIFSDLSDEQIERLLRVVRRRTFHQGDVIIREGEVGDRMYVLLDGTVEVSKALTMKVGRHDFQQLDKSFVRLEGQHHTFFGELGVLGRDVRAATVSAVNDCLVFEVAGADFDAYCEADPAAGYRIMRRIANDIAERLRRTNQDVVKLTTALSLALTRR